MIDGEKVTINGQEFIVPPLNFRSIRKLEKEIEALGDMEQGKILTAKDIDLFVKIILVALQRNYPDLTADEVEDMVDFKNVIPVVQAIMKASGFAVRGEAKPEETESPSSGT